MMRLIPPVAVPSSSGQIAASLVSAPGEPFGEALKRLCGVQRCVFFPSGRAALAETLMRWSGGERDEVVVPGYTCWSVAASVVRAGLKLRVVDVVPSTLDYDRDQLTRSVGERTLAVVAAHLFARTADTEAVANVARANGAQWIDDAAQALPEKGAGADATILSFGRGKPLALGGGGVCLGNEGLEPREPSGGGLLAATKLGVTAILARPAWYRLPQSMPFLGIGTTIYDPAFPMDAPFFRWQERLGSSLLSRRRELTRRRAENARALIRAVEQCDGWTVAAPERMGDGPLRLPVLAPDRATRHRVERRLKRFGVSAPPMYPATIAGIRGIEPHLARPVDVPGAAQLVDRLLTLPTYPTLSGGDLRRIESAFVTAAGEAA